MKKLLIGLGVLVVLVMIISVAGRVSGRFVPYNLYTHCGVNSLELDGKTYYADPPLGDGNGNPPAGWGNPDDAGWLLPQDSQRVTFIDWMGHRASFTTHPSYAITPTQLCS